jgi:hypothetical protein
VYISTDSLSSGKACSTTGSFDTKSGFVKVLAIGGAEEGEEPFGGICVRARVDVIADDTVKAEASFKSLCRERNRINPTNGLDWCIID